MIIDSHENCFFLNSSNTHIKCCSIWIPSSFRATLDQRFQNQTKAPQIQKAVRRTSWQSCLLGFLCRRTSDLGYFRAFSWENEQHLYAWPVKLTFDKIQAVTDLGCLYSNENYYSATWRSFRDQKLLLFTIGCFKNLIL